MPKKLKIILSILLLFVVTGIGLGIYVSSQLRPEELRKLVLKSIEAKLPNTQSSLEQVNVGLGLNLTVEFKKLEIKLRPEFAQGKDALLLAVDRFELKVPFWAILTSGGTITLGAKTPRVNYITFNKDQNNWKVAGGKISVEKNSEEKTEEVQTKGSSVEIPRFISKSKINVRFEDINANYDFFDGEKGHVVVEKFVLKDFNFSSSMAFEVATNVASKLKNGKELKVKILSIGQVDVKKYLESGVLSVSVMTDFSDISLSKLPVAVPNIKTNIQTDIFPDKKINLTLDSSGADQVFDLKFSANVTPGKVKVGGISFKMRPAKILATANEGLKASLSGVDTSSLELNLSGDVEIDEMLNTITPNLKWESQGDLVYSVIDQVKTLNGLSGELKGQKLFVKVLTKVLGGSVSTEVSGDVNLKDKDLANGKLPKLHINVVGIGMKVEKAFIQDYLYAKKATQEVANETTSNVSSAEVKPEVVKTQTEADVKSAAVPTSTPSDFPQASIVVNFKDVKIGETDFSLNALIETVQKNINIKDLSFKLGEGVAKGNLVADKKSASQMDGNFNFTMGKLNLSAFNPFLPSKLKNISGVTDTKLWGTFSKGKILTYSVDLESTTVNGKIEGLKLADNLRPYLEKVSFLKEKTKDKDLEVSDEFELFQIKAKATEKNVTLQNFKFIGLKNSISTNGKGFVSLLPTEQSELLMDISDRKQKLAEVLRKNIGRESLPVRIQGKGLDLSPDVGYTLKIASEGALKTKGKEALEKIIKSDKVEKLINNPKINDVIKSNAGKILDGLFK